MNAERRPTSARCFVYGDQRSVEHSLDALERYRDPQVPTRRVRAVHLSGDPLAVLATASGMRDLERLHGRSFDFAIQVEPTPGLRAASATDVLRDTLGADIVSLARLGEPGQVLLVCGADALDDLRAAELADAIEQHAPRLEVLMLVATMTLPAALRALLAAPGREVVYSTLANALLEPAVESFLDRRDPMRIVVAGQGAIVQTALGAVDFFVERARSAHALDANAIADLGRHHVALLDGHTVDTTLGLDPTRAAIDPHALLTAGLDALGVERIACPVTPAASGVLVVPVVG